MASKYIRSNKRSEDYAANLDTFIERLKKMRALNCSPSDVGMDNYIFKKWPFVKFTVLTKFL